MGYIYEIKSSKTKTQCLLDEKIVPYDACSSNNLEKAKDYYKNNYKYIGSGYTFFINDVKSVSEKLYHFFIRI